MVLRLNRFGGNVQEGTAGEHFAIPCDEKFRLFAREEIKIVLSEERFPRKADQLLTGFVELNEPQLPRVLKEDHVGNVFDDRLEQLTRVGQSIFHALALGHVFGDDDDVESAVRVPYRPRGLSYPEMTAVFSNFPELPAKDVAWPGETIVEMLLHSGLIARVDDQGHGLTDQGVCLIPEFGGGGGIDREERALRVDGQQHLRTALIQRPVAFLAEAQRFFGLFA